MFWQNLINIVIIGIGIYIFIFQRAWLNRNISKLNVFLKREKLKLLSNKAERLEAKASQLAQEEKYLDRINKSQKIINRVSNKRNSNEKNPFR